MLETYLFDRLGLPKHSAAVHAILQKSGGLLVAQIAQKIGVHRPAVYRALVALVTARYVHQEKTFTRTYYHAQDEALIRADFADLHTSLAAASFKKKTRGDAKNASLHTQIRSLAGAEGITAVFTDVVTHCKKGETFYRYTSAQNLNQINAYLPREYRAIRDKKKLERLVISNRAIGEQKRPRLERFIAYIPPEIDAFEQDIIQIIYGSRIAFIDMRAKHSFIIENAKLAEFQKVIFRTLYKQLTRR